MDDTVTNECIYLHKSAYISAKEPYISTKEPYTSAKKLYISET